MSKGTGGASPAVGGLQGLLLQLAGALREAGVPVGSGELLDAGRALEVTSWDNEAIVRETLATTLTKTADHRERFLKIWPEVLRGATLTAALDAQRELAQTPGDGDGEGRPGGEVSDRDPSGDGEGSGEGAGRGEGDGDGGGSGGGAGTTIDLDELTRAVHGALAEGSGVGAGGLRDLARLAIEAARQNQSGVVGVDVQRIRRMVGVQRGAEGSEELSEEALRQFTELLRRELEEQRAMRTGDLPPTRAVGQLGRELWAGQPPDEAAVLRAVHALRRELAVAGRSRRGARSGRVDLRRTIRASLETGGVPVEVVPQRERPHRPQLVALCDVSTSVSSSAVFFLTVISSLADAFSRLRTWAFIEVADEVTEACLRAQTARDLGRVITQDAQVADRTGYTDYGRVFTQLAAEADALLDRRTTLLVLGDARSNGRDPGLAAFAALTARAGRTLWLNPEPELYWNYGDSEAARYGKHCEMYRCSGPRDLMDLARVLASS